MTREEALEKGPKYFQKNKQEMVSLYQELYGETICNYCPGEIQAAFETIKRLKDQPISKYKLKPKTSITTIDGHWTNFNLTNEIAEMLIEKGFKDSFV